MKRKLILIPLMILAIIGIIGIVYAIGATTLVSPVNSYHTASDNLIEFQCIGAAQATHNITSIDIYTGTGGGWDILYTETFGSAGATNNSPNGVNYTYKGLFLYGEEFEWNCRINYTLSGNCSDSTYTYAANNKTIKIPYAGEVTLTTPTDNFYALNDSINFVMNASAEFGAYIYNISNIDFYNNHSGTWTLNYSFSETDPSIETVNTSMGYTSNLAHIADGTHFIWTAIANYTQVNISSGNQSNTPASSNYTIYVEYPPPITLNLPADGATSSAGSTVYFNITANNVYARDDSDIYCQIYTNLSGGWTPKGATIISSANASVQIPLSLTDGDYIWNARCYEPSNTPVFGFAADNFTVTVDATVPTIFVNFTNESWSNSKMNQYRYVPTDPNFDSCMAYWNITGESLELRENMTNSSITTAAENSFGFAAEDQNYTFYIACNDTGGNYVNSSQYEIRIDTEVPNIGSVKNGSRADYCDQWNISFTSNEEINYSINYTTEALTTLSVSDSSYARIHPGIYLPSQEENSQYLFNITGCDRAGNCNTSGSGVSHSYTFPSKLCTGWSYFGIYEAEINFSDILVDSGADYAYYWNDSSQEWVYATAGASSNLEFLLGIDHKRYVTALYESVNSTWARNTTDSTSPSLNTINISSGNNFLRMYQNVTMTDLARSMINSSDDWGIDSSQSGYGGLTYNLTKFYYSAYNNSLRDWSIDYIYNWSWNNGTYVSNISNYEVVWVYSPENLTWNGSAIWGNWSVA